MCAWSANPCACLSSSPLLWRLINFRLFCSDDCRSWPCDEKINNNGCCSKHAHIPDNDYWGICLFHVVWTIFFLVQLFLCGTHGIYFCLHPTFFSSPCQRQQHPLLFIFSSQGHDRQSSEQNNRKLISLHNNGEDDKHAHGFADF
jgi:hypothetical protein